VSPRFRLPIAAAALAMAIAAGCAHAPHKPRPEMPSSDIVSYGKSAFERHEYADAIEFLKGYLAREPSGERADEAHYLLALCYFRTSEWPSAVAECQIVINEFAGSTFVPDARYYLGLSYWKQSRPASYDQDYTKRSLAEFDRFLELYPDHPRAEEVKVARLEARARLSRKDYEVGRLYVKLGLLEPARFYFRAVQNDYPETPWAAWASLGEAKAWVKDRKWEESLAVLDRLLAATPPEEVAREARELSTYVKKRQVAARGGAPPAAAP
jgi:outer membrane protein assembly factor BamD